MLENSVQLFVCAHARVRVRVDSVDVDSGYGQFGCGQYGNGLTLIA
jgi:hypothetical protein